jgi:Flp pilus assembly protein TadG
MKSFLKDTSGNIALNIALLGIPVILSGGVAIDYSQFARKQSSLQNVTDSAALAVALDLQSKSQAEIEAKVDSYFKANLSAEQYLEIKNIKVEIPSSKEKVT